MLSPSASTVRHLITLTVIVLILDLVLLLGLYYRIPPAEQRYISNDYKAELASEQYLNLTSKARQVWLTTNIIFDRHQDNRLCPEAACYYHKRNLIVIQGIDRAAPERALTQVMHEFLHVLVDTYGIPLSALALMQTEYAAERNEMLKMKLALYGYSPGQLNWQATDDFRHSNRPVNELHSLLGSEAFTTISAELETYYSQYFKDRRQLIDRLEMSICAGDWQTLVDERLLGAQHHFRHIVRQHQALVTDDKLAKARAVWQTRCGGG